MEQPRKDHLVEVAAGLFNRLGYHQCGVDEIMHRSGVSKTTLYKHFPTKEHLILEVMRRRSEAFFAEISDRLEAHRAAVPDAAQHSRIEVIFDIVDEWISGGDFFGCNFVRAAAEYGDRDDPIHRHAAHHKHRLQQVFADLLCDLPQALQNSAAEQVMLVLDGAITTAQVRGRTDVIDVARKMVSLLLSAGFGLRTEQAI